MASTNKSTGILTVGNNAVMSGQAILAGFSITAAAADVTVTAYDNTAASGTVVFKYILDISVEGLSAAISGLDIKCTTGLYIVVAGVGAEVIAHYR